MLHRDGTADAHPATFIVDDIRARMQALAQAWNLPSSRTVTVTDGVRARLAGARLDRLRRVRTHGDFGPFNILVRPGGGGRIIDPSFEASVDRLGNRCACDEDVARFLTCIEFSERLSADERHKVA